MPIVARKCAEGEVAQVDQQHCYRSAGRGRRRGGDSAMAGHHRLQKFTRTGERVRLVHTQSAGAAGQ